MRSMYDSVNPASIPAGATMVAGYVDGRYANMPAMAARFPDAVRVPIAVFAHTDDGIVLDIETGDAAPAQAPGWVTMRRSHGIDPTVYCDSSTWPAVRQAFAAAGVPEPHYWIAAYDGVATIPAGAVAKQYRETDPWDLSVVADYWPGVDPVPPPPPAPAPVPQPVTPPTTLRGDEMAFHPLPFGYACDAAGKLTDKTKALAVPVPELGGPRITYRNVDLSLGCDFGNVRVRIAVHNAATGWSRVWEADIKSEEARYPIWLQPGDDKISIARMPASAGDTDGANVPASLLIEPVLA